jgi:hypothetical protein
MPTVPVQLLREHLVVHPIAKKRSDTTSGKRQSVRYVSFPHISVKKGQRKW